MTFLIETLGCKMNSYESEALKEQLIRDGLSMAKDDEIPDYVFVNTCAVTAVAEKKDVKTVRALHRQYPDSRIVVMGCSSQLHKERYLALEGVSDVFGTSDRHKVDECLYGIGKDADHVNLDSRHFSFDPLAISGAKHSTKAYLKIQDGCNNFCSYCIVPYTRGVSRSRKHEEVLEETRRLIDNGYKEIIIGGIDVGSYQDPDNKDYRLTELLSDMASLETDRRFRIRVSSIESSQITLAYIKLFRDHPDRLCPHFHIPLQSGSQHILKMMNRKYDLDYFLSMVRTIKEMIPNVGLSTDVISGFPGEDETCFEETYEFIRKIGFLRIHAFPYSERPGTVAARIKENIVPMAVRKERTNKLIALSEELERQYRIDHAGETVEVLIEEKNDKGEYQGYGGNYLPMTVASDEDLIDTFQTLKI